MAEQGRSRRLYPTGEPYNQAFAARLRMRKAEIGPRMTFAALSDLTGIPIQQLKFSVNDLRRMHLDEFILIAVAMGLDPAAEIVAMQALLSQRAAQHV